MLRRWEVPAKNSSKRGDPRAALLDGTYREVAGRVPDNAHAGYIVMADSEGDEFCWD